MTSEILMHFRIFGHIWKFADDSPSWELRVLLIKSSGRLVFGRLVAHFQLMCRDFSLVFIYIYIHIHIYLYVYVNIYVCVCVIHIYV